MTTIQDLPELVIIGILKNVMEDGFRYCRDIADSLPYLAICRQWRHLGLPIVYNTLLITYDRFLEDDKVVRKFSSDIPLVANSKCNAMVKRFQVRWPIESFTKDLDMLMNTIAMDKTAWPKDISGHLVGNAPDGLYGCNPQKLDNEMYEKMCAIIDNFRDTFPNVKEIKFDFNGKCGVTTQFISKFVDVYSDQLTVLKNDTWALLDLPCFPPNLEYLWYECQPMSFLSIPMINALPLKELTLVNIPNDFSWKQSCNSLVFPNLTNISLQYLLVNDQMERESLAHELGIQLDIPDSQYEQLKFPAVKCLHLFPYDNKRARINLKNVPRHLCELTYDGDLKGLEQISKLPVDSIGEVNIVFEDEIDSIDLFYKVTNKMFGNNIKNNARAVFQYLSEEPDIDFQKTSWENITDVCFQNLDSSSLIKAVLAMPRLSRLDIGLLTYIDEDVDWSSVANSKIETLRIEDFRHDGPLENPVNYTVQLFKSLKCLRRLGVPEELYDMIMPKLEEAKKEHQHLRTINVEKLPDSS